MKYYLIFVALAIVYSMAFVPSCINSRKMVSVLGFAPEDSQTANDDAMGMDMRIANALLTAANNQSLDQEIDDSPRGALITKAKGKGKEKPKRASKKPVPQRLTARERTGLTYSDDEGIYDVPIIDEFKWYRLTVRKASEKRLTEAFNDLAKTTKWSPIIAEAFYPKSSYVRFKGKTLEMTSQPMIPGLMYLKCKMSPDVADDMEQIQGKI
jgi:hypothetical protein